MKNRKNKDISNINLKVVFKKYLSVGAIILFTATCNHLIAQVDSYTLNLSPAPLSPEVSSLAKYIDFPISTYTGQANVSIPIYELKAGDITLPISLSYHTGGIKVEEIASSVGLGWSLNAGGVITRTVQGGDDFFSINNYKHPPYLLSYQLFQNLYYSNIAATQTDTQHDIFNFSFIGNTGKFVLDFQNNEPILIPKQDLLIDISSEFASSDKQIQITTAKGLKYTFGKVEKNTSYNRCVRGSSELIYNRQRSWFLTKVESPSSQHYIELNYEPKTLNYETMGAETKYEAIVEIRPDDKCTVINTINSWRLTEIITSNGVSVYFKKGLERCDLDGDFMLEEIIIKEQEGTPIKKIRLSYKYLTNGGLLKDLSLYDPNTQNNVEDIRLTLTNVEEFGYEKLSQTYLTEGKKHKFEYNRDIGLPSRFSNSQDNWGYYNGKVNQTLVPATFFVNKYLDGANRKPNLQYAKQGTISKITFPTGASTAFEYGLNECVNYSFEYYESESVIDKSYEIGNQDLYETDLLFEVGRSSEADVILATETETPFYSTYPYKVRLQLFSLNSDGTINQELFNSDYMDTSENSSSNTLSILEKITLKQGTTYKLMQTINNMAWAQVQPHFTLSVNWKEPDNIIDETTSGLRIERTSSYDLFSDTPIIKKYVYENGFLNNEPMFFDGIRNFLSPDYCNGFSREQMAFARSSVSRQPLTLTNGGIVGYGKVTILDGESGENGYIINNYYSTEDHLDLIIIPNPPYTSIPGIYPTLELGQIAEFARENMEFFNALLDSKDWKRGMPKTSATFNKNNNPKSLTTYTYKFYDDPTKPYFDTKDVYGVKVGTERVTVCDGGVEGTPDIAFYRYQSSRYELESKTETVYDETDSNKAVSSTITYEYDQTNFQLLKSTQINSDGKSFITENEYATNIQGATLGANLLRANHMHSQVLRNKQLIDGNVTSKSETYYNDIVGNTVPVSVAKYAIDDLESTIVNYKYDGIGNVIEVEPQTGFTTSYIWGYNQSYPVVKAENAIYAEIQLHGANIQSLSNADNDNCLVGEGCAEDVLRTALQALRDDANLQEAQITTYTYDPLIGMTSQTDPNGVTIYYEYDDFNRLRFVKDSDGNIINQNLYHYRGN